MNSPRSPLRRYFLGFVWMTFFFGSLPALAAARKAAPSVGLGVIDPIVQEAIRDGQIPGAVVLVGHDGQVIYRKAFPSEFMGSALRAMESPASVFAAYALATFLSLLIGVGLQLIWIRLTGSGCRRIGCWACGSRQHDLAW